MCHNALVFVHFGAYWELTRLTENNVNIVRSSITACKTSSGVKTILLMKFYCEFGIGIL